MLDKHIEDFVREKAGSTPHSGRTFFEHLLGTYKLLEERGAPVHVCLAGLCHSIYGTNAFTHASVPLAERKAVVNVIGPKAERLAWVFCACNRPRALIEAFDCGPPYEVEDRQTGVPIALSRQDLVDLLAIEIANLIEQQAVYNEMFLRVVDAHDRLREATHA